MGYYLTSYQIFFRLLLCTTVLMNYLVPIKTFRCLLSNVPLNRMSVQWLAGCRLTGWETIGITKTSLFQLTVVTRTGEIGHPVLNHVVLEHEPGTKPATTLHLLTVEEIAPAVLLLLMKRSASKPTVLVTGIIHITGSISPCHRTPGKHIIYPNLTSAFQI